MVCTKALLKQYALEITNSSFLTSVPAEGGWENSKFNASLFNLTIDHNITNLYGEYTDLEIGFDTRTDDDSECEDEELIAMGVSCNSSSSIGTASTDGVHSSFWNYIRPDNPIPARKDDRAIWFGTKTFAYKLDHVFSGSLTQLVRHHLLTKATLIISRILEIGKRTLSLHIYKLLGYTKAY
jgi:hypothetical protein